MFLRFKFFAPPKQTCSWWGKQQSEHCSGHVLQRKILLLGQRLVCFAGQRHCWMTVYCYQASESRNSQSPHTLFDGFDVSGPDVQRQSTQGIPWPQVLPQRGVSAQPDIYSSTASSAPFKRQTEQLLFLRARKCNRAQCIALVLLQQPGSWCITRSLGSCCPQGDPSLPWPSLSSSQPAAPSSSHQLGAEFPSVSSKSQQFPAEFPAVLSSSQQLPADPISSHQFPSAPSSSQQFPAAPSHQLPSVPISSHDFPAVPISSHQLPSVLCSSQPAAGKSLADGALCAQPPGKAAQESLSLYVWL